MIKALIIDDEQHCIDRITRLLEKNYADTIQLEASAGSVKDGIAAIKKCQPDLIFLDVQIQDGTGFDLLRACEKINFRIIFTTAYDHYAIEAFQTNGIDYLLKPIEEDRLKKAI